MIQGRGRGSQYQNASRGRGRGNDKATKFCDYCNTPGHIKETCFQLNGYPEWYQHLKAQKESLNLTKYEASRALFEGLEESYVKQDSVTSMLQGLQQELDKIKGKLQGDNHIVNMAHTGNITSKMGTTAKQEYAGTISASQNNHDNIEFGSWIIDSGATAHMCNDIKQLEDISSTVHPILVNLPNGSIKRVTKIGNVRVTPKLILREVLYTPYFRFNLLSVNKVTEHDVVKFIFLSNQCLPQDQKTDEVLAKARLRNNLYILENMSVVALIKVNECVNFDSVNYFDHEYESGRNVADRILNYKSACINNTNDEINKVCPNAQGYESYDVFDFDTCNTDHDFAHIKHDTSHMSTWHNRLPHALFSALQQIKALNIPLLSIDRTKLHACEICHKSKQTRLPFPISTSVAKASFELIHMDIWGPYTEPSLIGTSYMLTIVDDFSRVTWIYLLQNKSQVTDIFETFMNMVDNQFGARIKKKCKNR